MLEVEPTGQRDLKATRMVGNGRCLAETTAKPSPLQKRALGDCIIDMA